MSILTPLLGAPVRSTGRPGEDEGLIRSDYFESDRRARWGLAEDEKFEDDGLLGLGDELWLYKDPQSEIQGPFTATQMNEWFVAGYFPTGLLVKKAHQTNFVPLYKLTSDGSNPFEPPDQSYDRKEDEIDLPLRSRLYRSTGKLLFSYCLSM